jgi:hypothetical protein
VSHPAGAGPHGSRPSSHHARVDVELDEQCLAGASCPVLTSAHEEEVHQHDLRCWT